MSDRSDELLKELKESLNRVYTVFEMMGFLRAALSFLYWLIPLSITEIVFSVKPIVENPAITSISLAIIWGVSTPTIVVLIHRTIRRMCDYYRARGLELRALRRIYVASWSLCWLIMFPIALLLPGVIGARAYPLAYISAIALALTAMGIAERKYINSCTSLIAAFILYVAIATIIALPLEKPWDLAIGSVVLSYVIATLLYINRGLSVLLRKMGSRNHGEQH